MIGPIGMYPYPRASQAILCCLLSACVSTSYTGRTYPPTKHVDVYDSIQEVSRPYENLGQIQAEAPDAMASFALLEEKMVREAMARGADGIVFELATTRDIRPGSQPVVAGPSDYVDEDQKLRRRGGGDIWRDSVYQPPPQEKHVTASLIRYSRAEAER